MPPDEKKEMEFGQSISKLSTDVVDSFSNLFTSIWSTGSKDVQPADGDGQGDEEQEEEEQGPSAVEQTLISAAEEQLYSLTTADGVMGPTGKKRIMYPDGGCYEGPVLKGEWHGKGKLTYSNGAIYEGDFVHDIRHGKGRFTGAAGESFDGDWVNGEPNGKGKMTYQNGEQYEGDILAGGIFHGRGVYTWADSLKRYEGEWQRNTFHGKGKFCFDNGDTYEGEWKEDQMHGEGVKVEGGITYKVHYRDGFLTAYSRDGVLTNIVNEKVVLAERRAHDPVLATSQPWNASTPGR